MKVSIPWLKEFVDLRISVSELLNLLPLRSVSIKEVRNDSIELDMKGYNRADLLSMRGVAQEIAAITDSKVKFSDDEVKSNYGVPEAKVKVENLNLCPVYCLAKIENLKVEQSNDTWVKKLSECGIRTINNVADVTNLIMLEYGQPMHAFDSDSIGVDTSGEKAIMVRTAKKGERITTLDGKTRDLETSDLLIADSLNPLGIAGVMGGKDSEITDSTTTILLEAAIFDPANIRKTATRLGLPSEASKRFQHGLTKKRLLQALDAAIKMYESLGGKLTALSIVGNLTEHIKKVRLTQKKLDSLVGIKVKPEDVEMYLEKLNFKAKRTGVEWEVSVPYFRLDIDIEEDLIEEVARMYGYEKIPAQKLLGIQPQHKEDPVFKTIYDLKVALKDTGLTEVQTYSFYSTAVIKSLGWSNEKDKYLVKVANPISAETEYLRQSIWPNLLEAVSKNLRKGFKDIAIFEIGKAFNVGPDGNPVENYRLAIALCNGTDNPLEELYQIIQHLNLHLNVGLSPNKGVNLKQTKPPAVAAHLFHPKRFLAFEKDGKQIGGLAEVHLRMLNKLGIEKRVAVLEIELGSFPNRK